MTAKADGLDSKVSQATRRHDRHGRRARPKSESGNSSWQAGAQAESHHNTDPHPKHYHPPLFSTFLSLHARLASERERSAREEDKSRGRLEELASQLERATVEAVQEKAERRAVEEAMLVGPRGGAQGDEAQGDEAAVLIHFNTVS